MSVCWDGGKEGRWRGSLNGNFFPQLAHITGTHNLTLEFMSYFVYWLWVPSMSTEYEYWVWVPLNLICIERKQFLCLLSVNLEKFQEFSPLGKTFGESLILRWYLRDWWSSNHNRVQSYRLWFRRFLYKCAVKNTVKQRSNRIMGPKVSQKVKHGQIMFNFGTWVIAVQIWIQGTTRNAG